MAATVVDSIALGAADNTASLTTGSLTVSGSNRVLYVAVGSGAGTPTDPTGVKWGGSGGTDCTQLGTTLNLGANCKWSLWRLIAPTAQSSTVYASWAGNQDERWIIGVAVQDADQTTPNNTVATAQASGAGSNPTVAATSVSGDLVLDFVAFLNGGGNNLTLAADASQAELEDIGGGAFSAYEGAAASSETASGTSTTMSWTIAPTNDRDWGIFAFAVNGAAAGNTSSPTTGTLRYVGQTPTVEVSSGAGVTVTPSVGTYQFVGQAPTVGFTHSVAPSVGTLVFAGQQPSVSAGANATVAPVVGTVRFDGQQPSVAYTDHVTVAPSVGTVRFVGQTPVAGVTGGNRTAIVFPSNGATPVRFRWSGAGNYPDIQPLTLIWRYYPIQQTGYYVTFFHSRTDGSFVGDQTYFGCHPYPQGGGSGTTHNWEISIEGMDDITDENANSTVVTKAAWYSQAASTRSNGGGQSIVDYYWDLATASTRRISHLTVDGTLTNAANDPGITFGCASWNNDENLSGRLRGLQIYSSQLSEADIEALNVCQSDAEVLSVCSARSITSLWYLNVNPTPDDITDKSGNGNDPAWVGAERPTLWTEFTPSAGVLRFEGQQPSVTTTSSATVTPSVGTVRYAGQQPTVAYTDHKSVAPSVGTYRFDGLQPSVAYTDHQSVAPSVGTLLFAGQQPSVTSSAAQSVAPSVGTLRFEGLQPTATVSEPGLASPQVGTIRFLGQQPSVGYTHSVDPLSAVVRIEGDYPSVTVTANEWASPVTGAVQFNGQQPSTALTANIWVEPSHGTLRLDGQQPELVEGGDKTVSPYHGVLRLDGRAPSILGVEPPRDVMFGGGPTRSDRKKFKDWLEELNRNPIVVSTKTGVVRIRGNRPIVGVTETYDPFVVSKDVLRPLLRLPRKRVAAQATDNVDQMIAAELRYAEELQAKKRKKRRKQDEEILLLM